MNEASVAATIDKIADVLGVAATEVWSTLLRQAPISATTAIATWLIVTLALVLCAHAFPFLDSSEPGAEVIRDEMIAPYIFFMTMAGLAFFAGLSRLGLWLSAYWNPHFWAVHYILDRLS